MRKSPNVAAGRAASDATTAEPSIFRGQFPSLTIPQSRRPVHAPTQQHAYSCLMHPTREQDTTPFSIRGLEGAGNSN
jgi:hypothetical protein